MQFQDSEYGIECGENGYVSRTTKGGLNRILQPRVTTEDLNSIFFINANTGYSVGRYAQIIKSTNGGLSFINSSESIIHEECFLYRNYPNPFNPVIKILFYISIHVIVKIVFYDNIEKALIQLVNKKYNTGQHYAEFNNQDNTGGV